MDACRRGSRAPSSRSSSGRALRGQGYALTELGDLAAAAQKYRESFALEPDNTLSEQELEYIESLRTKP